MKDVKTRVFYCLFIFFILVTYTLFFPVRMSKRFVYTVNKVISLAEDTGASAPDAYYVTDQEIGYLDTKLGTMTYHFATEGDARLTGNLFGYAVYDKFGETVQIFNNRGEKVNDVSTPGYPYVAGDTPAMYIIKTNGCGFSSYLLDGTPMIKEFATNALITSVNSDKHFNTAVSFSDGKALLLNKEGTPLLTSLGDDVSELKIAKNAVSDGAGKYFAVLSGIKPEFLSVYDLPTKSVIERSETKSNLRYSPLMKLMGTTVYYESEKGVTIHTIKKHTQAVLPMRGELMEFDVSVNGELAAVTRNGEMSYIYVYKPNGVLVYYNEFYSDVSNIKYMKDGLFYVKIANDMVLLSGRYSS